MSDALREVHPRREGDRAVDVELLLAAGLFDRGVFQEVGRGLPELRCHVLEGFHRGADLPELDRADVRACVIRGAQLRLAQPCRDTCLTEPLTQLP